MQYRKLGKTGLMVSEVSFGGHQTGGYHGQFKVPLKQRVKVIERGLELGINYFDTTEEIEAESLSGVFEVMGGRPDNITVTSMYPHYKRLEDVTEGIREMVAEAIENRLKYFDPIDIFNLCGNGLPYSRERTLGALEALEQAREQGKIKHYGFSTHTMKYALAMIEKHPEFGLVMFPYNVVIPRIADLLFPVAQQHDVAVVGMKALAARGLFNLGIDPAAYGREVRLPVAAIKWVLQSPAISCTIPAMNSLEEVEENSTASGAPLTEEEQNLLQEMRAEFDRKVETDPDWYYHRDWTRRLYGEEQAEAAG